jgi:hypothetical protein
MINAEGGGGRSRCRRPAIAEIAKAVVALSQPPRQAFFRTGIDSVQSSMPKPDVVTGSSHRTLP